MVLVRLYVVQCGTHAIILRRRRQVNYPGLLLSESVVDGADRAVNDSHELHAAREESRRFDVLLGALQQLLIVNIINLHQACRQVERLKVTTAAWLRI